MSVTRRSNEVLNSTVKRGFFKVITDGVLWETHIKMNVGLECGSVVEYVPYPYEDPCSRPEFQIKERERKEHVESKVVKVEHLNSKIQNMRCFSVQNFVTLGTLQTFR